MSRRRRAAVTLIAVSVTAVGVTAISRTAIGAARASAPMDASSVPVTSQARAAARVVLVGLDAFRWDYLQRPGAANLRALAARGARAERLVPSFPSKTYPNFYTLVTGLTPEHHGIVANSMVDSALGRFAIGNDPAVRDARWFGGEPIWVTAERQGVRTAAYFWPGDEAAVGGVRPTWFVGFHKPVSRADRVFRALEWLAMPADRAPRLVTLYFEDVDDASHAVGPMAPRTDSAIAAVDSAVGALVEGIRRLGLEEAVDIVVVADHGMAETSPSRVIYLDDYVAMDSLTVVDWSPIAAIAPKAGAGAYVYGRLKAAHPHLATFRRAEVPARYHFNANPRITPIVGIADEGWTITSRAEAARATTFSLGMHGYDNQLLSMGGILVAAGPGVARGVVTPAVANVHVYSLLAALLGVTPARTDGSLDSVRAFLIPR